MDRRLVLSALRIGFAAAVVVAIVAQLAELAALGRLNVVNFFSFFTIQSNLIGVASFAAAAAAWRRPSPGWLDMLRGGAVVYLTVTLVVYTLLLQGEDVDTAVPWVNTIVHGVFPLAVIADWLIDPPAGRISFRRSLWWLAYPVAWLAWTFARGALVGWYPYPFLDPANGGYGTVAVYVVAIFAFGTLLCAIVSAAGRALGARRGPEERQWQQA